MYFSPIKSEILQAPPPGNLCMPHIIAQLTPYPEGFTLHMTGYAPVCTKSKEKGSFLDIRRRRRLLQKGYIFRC